MAALWYALDRWFAQGATMTNETLKKAARLRRLWRSYDLKIGTSGSANGRARLGSHSGRALYLPFYELTASNLIRMSRAARGQDT